MQNKTKILILLVLVAFSAVLFGCTEQNNQEQDRTNQNNSASPSQNSQATYNLSQVSTHNTESDCWAIVNGKVYDITAYINQHPGGKPNIIKACGVEATSMFETKPNGKPHSENAKNTLESFYKGDLVSG